MSRIEVQYTRAPDLGRVSGSRWLDINNGRLYMDEAPGCAAVRNFVRVGGSHAWITKCGLYAVAPLNLAPSPGLMPPPDAHGGLKHDGGKPRWSLLMRGCADALQAVVRVLTFGAQKYADDSWQGVQNGQQRYRDALYRHLNAIERGELVDDESGESHWAHVATNALFLYELHKK